MRGRRIRKRGEGRREKVTRGGGEKGDEVKGGEVVVDKTNGALLLVTFANNSLGAEGELVPLLSHASDVLLGLQRRLCRHLLLPSSPRLLLIEPPPPARARAYA